MTMHAEPYVQIPQHAAARPLALLQPLGRALYHARILVLIAACHLAAGIGISIWAETPFASTTTGILLTALKLLFPTFLLMLFLMRFVWMACTVRPAQPTKWFINDIRTIIFDPDRLAFGAVTFGCVAVMFGTFSYLKEMIPVLNYFAWDTTFALWDRTLHGGVDPWRILQPLTGTPLITFVLNVFYNVWFLLLYFVAFYACFDINNRARSLTFLIAFALCWIVGGNLLATVLSSVGPAFYADFGYGDLFAPQMAMLRDVSDIYPVWALSTQAALLDGFQNDGALRGISAMPSMHVTIAVVIALYAFTIRRWLGWIMAAYAAMIMIGSVHLAWHYAIDGYLGAAIAVAAWWVARTLTRRFSV